jgi:hypothetical protein
VSRVMLSMRRVRSAAEALFTFPNCSSSTSTLSSGSVTESTSLRARIVPLRNNIPLHCRISTRPMSQMGHTRQSMRLS